MHEERNQVIEPVIFVTETKLPFFSNYIIFKLKYNRHITVYWLQVYSIMTQYLCALSNGDPSKSSHPLLCRAQNIFSDDDNF